MIEEIGIVRQCRQCSAWLSIERFRIRWGKPSRVCKDCVGRAGQVRARGVVLTALGHQAIREFEAVA